MTQIDKKDSWKMFDEISSTYDRLNRILSLGRDLAWRRSMGRFVPQTPDLKILDLATGTGDQLIALFELGFDIRAAVGVDLSQEMLSIAKQKIADTPYWNRIEWLRADAECLPFDAGSFDVVTLSFGIRNMPDPLQALREAYRVLRKGGRLCILEFSLPPKPIRGVYLLYLRHFLPRIGASVSKKASAYRYLNETIEEFPSQDTFSMWMHEAGFYSVQFQRMALGAVTLYIGEKSEHDL